MALAAGHRLQMWRLAYPEGVFTRITNDVNQYSGVSVTSDHDALVTTLIEWNVGIWTSDAAAARWEEAVATAPGSDIHQRDGVLTGSCPVAAARAIRRDDCTPGREAPRRLLTDVGSMISWSPQGPLDGTSPRQLTTFPDDGRTIADYAWSADGRLAVARVESAANIVLFRGLRRSAR